MPCFFDLSKAFDSVPHDPLLHTPCNLGLPAHLLCWFRSYLTDRFQQVSISSCLSSKAIVSSGVPQGSILGPLRFILYVNDLPKVSFSPNSILTMHAEDILHSQPNSFLSLSSTSSKKILTLCHPASIASSLQLMWRKASIWLLLTNLNHLCHHFLHFMSTIFPPELVTSWINI